MASLERAEARTARQLACGIDNFGFRSADFTLFSEAAFWLETFSILQRVAKPILGSRPTWGGGMA